LAKVEPCDHQDVHAISLAILLQLSWRWISERSPRSIGAFVRRLGILPVFPFAVALAPPDLAVNINRPAIDGPCKPWGSLAFVPESFVAWRLFGKGRFEFFQQSHLFTTG
jgi:hypothetical protein